MIIVGQTRDVIINFKRINFLKIEADENEYDIEMNYDDDNWDVIGTYDSFERAKEVLNDLVNSFSFTSISGSYEEIRAKIEITKLARYKMPEK